MKLKKLYQIAARIFCCSVVFSSAMASEIIEVLPLTDRIIMVHFDDGSINFHNGGQTWQQDIVTQNILNISSATITGSYAVISSDDPNYSTSKNPVLIGRKSKGTEFTGSYAKTQKAPVGYFVSEHWIYLFLSSALQRGKTYTLNTSSLASNTNTFTFTYVEKNLRSEAVHVNQIGYATSAPLKFGYVYHWMGDKGGLDLSTYAGNAFGLVNTVTGLGVFSGTLVFRKSKSSAESGQSEASSGSKNSNYAQADVYECDFSSFNTPGAYVLTVQGIGSSFPFIISDNAFKEPFLIAMKGIFGQRSGISLTPPFTDLPRPAPHNSLVTPGFDGRLKFTSTRYFDVKNTDALPADKGTYEAGFKGVLTTSGWYQDAGDWDAYLGHTKVPAFLLNLYETNPAKFTDGELIIPESGNGLPDLLDEARWLIKLYYSLRHEIMAKGWGTGGVPGSRIMGDLWGSDNGPGEVSRGSWQDTDRDWYVSGEDPWISFRYAALAAQYAYVLSVNGLSDPQGITPAIWQQEAIDAYSWAVAHTLANDANPAFPLDTNPDPEVDSEKDSPKRAYYLKDYKLFADAALFRLTGASSYHASLIAAVSGNALDDNAREESMFASWLYASITNRTLDATTLNTVKNFITSAADFETTASAPLRGARWGGNYSFPLLIGQATTPMVTKGVGGFQLNKISNASKAQDYIKYIYTTADYFLGNNPLNTTWVSGLGERYPKGIFNLDGFVLRPNGVRKGIVPYGAFVFPFNNGGPTDPRWQESTAYPAASLFSGHERWFDCKYTPITSEYTIHQTQIISAHVFGFLYAQTKDMSVKIDQFAVFPTYSDTLSVGDTFNAGVSLTSGLAPTFTIKGPLSFSGSIATTTFAGIITITAINAGNSAFNPVNEIRLVVVRKISQTISGFAGSIAPQNKSVGSIALSSSATSGLPVTYSVAGPASVSGNIISLTGFGVVTVTAFQSGSALYYAAQQQVTTFKVYQFTQTITSFPVIPTQTFGTSPFTITGTASSDLPLSFKTMGPATVTGNTLKITGAGNVTITAMQVGDLQFLFAQPVSQIFAIQKATQTITGVVAVPDMAIDSPPFTLTATVSSGLVVTFKVENGPALISGNKLYPNGNGLVTITANQVGSINYLPAAPIFIIFRIGDITSQTISECTPPSAAMQTISGFTFTGSQLFCTTATSGLQVGYTLAGAENTNELGVFSLTGFAVVTITAFQPGNNEYSASNTLVKEIAIYINTVTGIDFGKTSSLLHVWPNPASDVLNIEFEETGGVICIRDLLGKVIIQENINQQKQIIQLKNLPVGIYLLDATFKGRHEMIKLEIAQHKY